MIGVKLLAASIGVAGVLPVLFIEIKEAVNAL